MKMPKWWHEKSNMEEVKKGYIHKIWFFNDTRQSAQGFWLNEDQPVFSDVRVRYAFAHAMNIQKVMDQVLRKDYFRLEGMYRGVREDTQIMISGPGGSIWTR